MKWCRLPLQRLREHSVCTRCALFLCSFSGRVCVTIDDCYSVFYLLYFVFFFFEGTTARKILTGLIGRRLKCVLRTGTRWFYVLFPMLFFNKPKRIITFFNTLFQPPERLLNSDSGLCLEKKKKNILITPNIVSPHKT